MRTHFFTTSVADNRFCSWPISRLCWRPWKREGLQRWEGSASCYVVVRGHTGGFVGLWTLGCSSLSAEFLWPTGFLFFLLLFKVHVISKEMSSRYCLTVCIVVTVSATALARSLQIKYWLFCGKTLIDCVCNSDSQLSIWKWSASSRITLPWALLTDPLL